MALENLEDDSNLQKTFTNLEKSINHILYGEVHQYKDWYRTSHGQRKPQVMGIRPCK